MRLLHTSDWHLGRTFHGMSLLAEQRAAMDRVVQAVQEHAVDAVLVSGDVYDRANPSVEFVELLDETLARLRGAGATVVLTSGNHDSAPRLGFGSRLMDAAGVHVRTRTEWLDTPVELRGDAETVLVYGIPYLEPRLVGHHLGVEPGAGHAPVVRAAMERILHDAAKRRDGEERPVRVVVMAHVFAAGGQPSESERTLSVGEVDRIPASLFDGADYAALGHLHRPQEVLPHVRYPGSPLPYSFSEAGQDKGALLVDLIGAAPAAVTTLSWPPPRPLARIRGTLAELLSREDLTASEHAWVQATLTDAQRPPRPMETLRERFPHALVLTFDPQGERPTRSTYREMLAQSADPVAVASGFVSHVRERDADADERALLSTLVHRAQASERSGERA